ncbi:PTS fructose transporter subunit IIB, partial [Pseudomonas aeruginosa]|uniref:PTS fructose transporter subunit IIB n=1 Tax=Pseudomonas aeruginosa TaxID=287 RepID=UPI0027E58459
MKLAIVTACPGGQVTSVLAARLLRGAAERLGWETCVEANAGSRPEGELSAEQIAEADWVLLVGVEPLAAARFVGKPVDPSLIHNSEPPGPKPTPYPLF